MSQLARIPVRVQPRARSDQIGGVRGEALVEIDGLDAQSVRRELGLPPTAES